MGGNFALVLGPQLENKSIYLSVIYIRLWRNFLSAMFDIICNNGTLDYLDAR